jgi:ubiquinone/menaquinone biosynthesis C-methylase UbiE
MKTAQEESVKTHFSNEALLFDKLDADNPILVSHRKRVRKHVLSLLRPGDHILELNAGTGLDADFFALRGFKVHATDNADGMIRVLEQKINRGNTNGNISVQCCSYHDLSPLKTMKFDHIFSNMGGLNCTSDIQSVIAQFRNYLNPGGIVTLVVMPRICPWELLLALKGNFKVAFRRLGKQGAKVKSNGSSFSSYYYSPAELIAAFGKDYHAIAVEGLGITVPPPYLHNFISEHPVLYKYLLAAESRICKKAPFNSWADHCLVSMHFEPSLNRSR